MAVIWGVNFSVVKWSLREMMPLAFNALRLTFASVLILGVLWLRERSLRVLRADLPRILLLGLVGHTGYQLLFINGIARTTATNSSLILASTPVFVAVIGTALGLESLRGAAWFGVVLSFFGIALVIHGSSGGLSFGSVTLLGDLLVLAGTICWSLYTVLARSLLERYSPLKLTAISMGLGTIFLVIASVPVLAVQDWQTVSLPAWGGLAYSFTLAIVLSYVIWYTGISRVGNTRTALYSNLTPLFAVAVAWVTLGEVITTQQIAGAILVFVSLYISGMRVG